MNILPEEKLIFWVLGMLMFTVIFRLKNAYAINLHKRGMYMKSNN